MKWTRVKKQRKRRGRTPPAAPGGRPTPAAPVAWRGDITRIDAGLQRAFARSVPSMRAAAGPRGTAAALLALLALSAATAQPGDNRRP